MPLEIRLFDYIVFLVCLASVGYHYFNKDYKNRYLRLKEPKPKNAKRKMVMMLFLGFIIAGLWGILSVQIFSAIREAFNIF